MTKDRLEKLGSGLPSQLEAAGSRPLLTSVDTVSELLRSALGRCIERRGNYLAQRVPASDAMQGDIQDMRDLAALLYGWGDRADAFFVQPWNSAAQMGRYLKDTYSLSCDESEAVFTILMSAVNEVYSTIDALEQSGQPIEENAWQIDGIVEMYTYAILGLPWDDD